jgi:hypothetical protein
LASSATEHSAPNLFMIESVEEQTLRDVERFPFTNVTRLYRHAGTVLPDAVGGGCLWMAARLARLLRERLPRHKVTHHDLGTPGSHLMTVSDDGRERLVYEPSLFQVAPFSLTRFDDDPSLCTSDVFPPLEVPMRLRFGRPSADTLRVELLSPRGSLQRALDYSCEQPVRVDEDDPYKALPFLEPQDQLYIHILNPDFSKSVLLMNTRTRRVNVGKLRDRLYVDSEPGFDSRFERIGARLQLSAGQLRDLLHGALAIHNAHYPHP